MFHKLLLSRKGITYLIVTSFCVVLSLNVMIFITMNKHEKTLKSNYFHQIELLSVYWQNIFSGDELEFIREGMEFDNIAIYYQNLLIQLKNNLPITDIKILNMKSQIIVDPNPLYQIGIPFEVDSAQWREVTQPPAHVHIFSSNQDETDHVIVFLPLRNSLDKITAVLYINTVPIIMKQLNTFRMYTIGFFILAMTLTIGFGFFISYLFHKYTQLLEHESQRQRLAQIGEMASTIAHEIRNPLGIMKGATSLLKNQITNEKSKKVLSFIADEINRLNELINHMLKFVKTPDLTIETVNLSSLLEEQTNLFIKSHPEIEFSIRIKENIMVEADGNALKQIIINVLRNSLKAVEELPENTVKKIELETNTYGKEIELKIYNNGPRISEELFPKLFQPFFTTRDTGTGLGLPVCKSLLEQMSGNITVQNNNNPSGVITLIKLRKKR